MARKTPGFSHRDKFSSYLSVVAQVAETQPTGCTATALDIPAGAGHLGEVLRAKGFQVTNADINGDRPDFVFADMNAKLPFDDGMFDLVTCCEGIEHVLHPAHLISELSRITKPGGHVIISTPNIMHMYSRIQFLFTGTFFNFNPALLSRVNNDHKVDRGHVSPLSYHSLRYLTDDRGLDVLHVLTDRYKKKILIPVFAVVWLIGWFWCRRLLLRGKRRHDGENRRTFQRILSAPITLGRTLILVTRKRG